MTIRLICICGLRMDLPAKYAGEHVQCPECRAMLRIPDESEDVELIRWVCSCGQRLKARPKSIGRVVRCPKCGADTTVPKVEVRDISPDARVVRDPSSGKLKINSAESNTPLPVSPTDDTAALELDGDTDEDIYDLGSPKTSE